ncbi:MAG TPA: HhH-GPD-type base excision DNA repair protein [Gaiellaceae bacterium]|nr:HhH-GPD-type base excision DNA repair protein [Gaiellaceae bacterium]
MPDALYFTDDPAACELIARDPFALLIGFAIDQQVPVQKAFAGPLALKQRVGTLEPAKLAELDLEEAFSAKPAIHRFPGSMARRVRELAAVVAEDYGGDASRIWNDAADAAELKKRLGALPGFGPMKVTAIASVLAHRFDLVTAKPLVPGHACLGEVDSPQALADYQAAKRARKATMRAASAGS